tara:strand:- start:509 stop:628 length:120 start_codon:yes stop_codon:yes gene_type:complete
LGKKKLFQKIIESFFKKLGQKKAFSKKAFSKKFISVSIL